MTASKNDKKNSNGQLQQECQLIDKVLQDQPEKVKQQVWEFVARFNIHPEDEAFWAIFVMMGYMQLLLTESPEQWTNLWVLHTFGETKNSDRTRAKIKNY